MLELTTLDDDTIFVTIDKINAIIQKPTHTEIYQGSCVWDVKEPASEIYIELNLQNRDAQYVEE